MKGSETRERIYRAAMQLAARDGLMTLTLENVAEESGLSKGGVMHHFRSKEELLSGVITHFTDQVEREMTRLVAEDPNPTYRWVRAMLRIMTSTDHDNGSDLPTRQTLDQFMLSVLAATIHNPEVVKPVQAIGQRLRGRLTSIPEEGIEQLMMWLVLDGLFLWQFVGLLSPEDPLIEQVHANLLQKLEMLSGNTVPPRALRPSTKTSSDKSKNTKVPNSVKRSDKPPKKSPNRSKKGGG
jgi:AcrR family transcriptional regulator